MEYAIRMFLIGNRAEVKGMCITEYNEAETMKMFKEEGREEGRKEGNISTLYGLYSDGDITLEKAAVKAGMSEQAFLEVAKKIVGI